MRTYDNEDISLVMNSNNIKYDAECMHIFIEQLERDLSSYKNRARVLEKGYVNYHDNETFAGLMADTSKQFIYEVQGDKLHVKNLDLKNSFLYECSNIEDKFIDEVDSSPRARLSTSALLMIKKDFESYYAVIDSKGHEIESRAKRLVGTYGKWGISTIPNYGRALQKYDEFSGNNGFLDNCIDKLEAFDQESCNALDSNNYLYSAQTLQTDIKGTANILNSMTVYQPDIESTSAGIMALSTAAWNPFKVFFGSSKDVSIISSSYTDEELIQALKDQYGFTDEQAKLINDAYMKYERECAKSKKTKSNNQKMHEFFSNLAALNEGYGTNFDFSLDFEIKTSSPSDILKNPFKIIEDANDNFNHNIKDNAKKIKGNFTAFNMLGSNPSTQDALDFFNGLGVNAKDLKEAINDQHTTCKDNKKRDFVHECAIIAVMSDTYNVKKLGVGVDDINAAIGYKGDVYSGKMGIDDKKSDVEAYNLYYRMKDCEDGNIWDTMTEYNIGVENGSINGSKEFLEHFGDGDAEKGMEKLKEDLDTENVLTDILGRNSSIEEIEKTKKEFIEYVSKESGVG